ncbi:hypothetical protein [Escherichia coli]|uniref:hypothetical protein n=1 Tax=Escherichia coli TaxID=562 RepID=UPI00191B159F|nr:hypothetical protein [Escherichia coli]CAD5666683.1 Uncharacterised protein [Escherichia coli]
MQPSPAMQALIEQIYHIFRRYPVPQKFVVCCEYCLSQQEQKALRSTSLRAIPYSLINAWAFNNQSILKERARQAIENPPKQPEQGTQHQVWVDDWIIDECLCAMYDASSESPGK